MKVAPHKSSTGMDANIWVVLIYVITLILGWVNWICYVAWVFPLVFLLTEKQSEFVKFHAIQAMALYIVNAAVCILFSVLAAIVATSALFNPFGALGMVGGIVTISVIWTILRIIVMVGAILALIKAFQYEEYRIPVIGPLADKLREMIVKK